MVSRGKVKRQRSAFARQLEAWMALAGLDVPELAAAVGVSTVTVSRWLRDVDDPRADRWLALSRALKVEYAEIVKLLLNVDLLPLDVRVWAERLAEMPFAQRQEYMRLLEELVAESGHKSPGGRAGVARQGAGS